jgi:hypothetical protein
MKAKILICSVVGGMTLAGAVSTAQAAWLAPTGGWQVDYQASSGNTPYNATPAWGGSGYQDTNPVGAFYSTVVTDGEQTLLLDNTTIGGPMYKLNTGAGAGSYSDNVTLDFRFRLLDGISTEQQWAFSVDRPGDVGNTTTHSFNLSFRRTEVLDALTYTAFPVNLGTNWHNARFLIDVAANTANLYLDDSSTPMATVTGTIYPGLYNQTWFGDGMGQVLGKAEVSYFRWTNNEFAAVPEPASMGLLTLGGSLLMMKRRRGVA